MKTLEPCSSTREVPKSHKYCLSLHLQPTSLATTLTSLGHLSPTIHYQIWPEVWTLAAMQAPSPTLVVKESSQDRPTGVFICSITTLPLSSHLSPRSTMTVYRSEKETWEIHKRLPTKQNHHSQSALFCSHWRFTFHLNHKYKREQTIGHKPHLHNTKDLSIAIVPGTCVFSLQHWTTID